MIKRTLLQVQEMVGGTGAEQWPHVSIAGISKNSREVAQGNLYVPIQGERFDGHVFAADAIANGAAATFWKKDVPNPPEGVPVIFVEDTLVALQMLAKAYRNELGVKVIGITGSNGKTSTKDIVTSILAEKFKVQKTIGNYNNHIGLPLTLLQLEEDTDIAVLEMGMSNFGEISFLSKLARPDVAVITNIGESHMMELGSRDGIAQAKMEIVDGLDENGLFIYNGDEPLLQRRAHAVLLPKVTFGQHETNDYHPLHMELRATGTTFTMNQTAVSFFLPALGKHNVYNTLACMAVGSYLGVTWEEMRSGLAKLEMTGMRMEVEKCENGVTIINDAYNASPTSMRAALAFMKELNGYNKKIVVLGDMLELGEQEEQFHYEVGKEITTKTADYVFAFGTLGAYIAKGAAEHRGQVESYMDKELLGRALQACVSPGDVVLMKASRGTKLEEILPYIQ